MQVTQSSRGAGASWVCSVLARPCTYHGARPPRQTHRTRWPSQRQLQQKEKRCSVGLCSIAAMGQSHHPSPATRFLHTPRTTNPWSNGHTSVDLPRNVQPAAPPTPLWVHKWAEPSVHGSAERTYGPTPHLPVGILPGTPTPHHAHEL